MSGTTQQLAHAKRYIESFDKLAFECWDIWCDDASGFSLNPL